jgi:hypothetical protein
LVKKALFGVIAGLAILVLGFFWANQWLALRETRRDLRQLFFSMMRPVRLTNCTLERFGSERDGGYLMCSNLLGQSQVGYSYGIAGDDNWGCDVSKRYKITVHEYDCFDPRRPSCPGGSLNFHEECVGPSAARDGSRVFDSVMNQIVHNGDADKHIIMKMDVEGAELDSLLAVPDEQLDRIEQLAIELHKTDTPKSIQLQEKLEKTFYVAYVHANNYACHADLAPFSSEVNELLFVNKRLATVDTKDTSVPSSPLAAANNPQVQDCQPTWP